jgi:hypothetical protein
MITFGRLLKMMILSKWIFLLAVIKTSAGFSISSHSIFRSRKTTSTDTSTTGRFSTISNGEVSLTSTVKIIKNLHPFSPPTWLQELPLHSPTIPPFFDDKAQRRRILPSDLTITRVSLDPPVFLVKNFCPDEKNNALMKYALENNLEYSGTSAGDIVKQRVGSYTGWVYPPDKDEQDQMIGKENNNIAKNVAGYMTELSRMLFVPDFLKEAMDQSSEHESESYYSAEALQVVRYVIGGKYDVHHDGMNRFLTVLTYLNGVAGTWFPYAIVDNNNQQPDARDFEDLPNMSSGNAAHDKIPGKDGLLITNYCPYDSGVPEDNKVQTCTNNILKIEKGDAIVFYNYDWIENPNAEEDMPQTGPIINWRSIHSGMRTTEEKWIATNWFYFHE